MGGGVKYSGAKDELENSINSTGIPFAVTQAGKSSLDETNSKFVGSIGVTAAVLLMSWQKIRFSYISWKQTPRLYYLIQYSDFV